MTTFIVAGAKAGTKKDLKVFNAPMQRAAREMQKRKGATTRLNPCWRLLRLSYLRGYLLPPRGPLLELALQPLWIRAVELVWSVYQQLADSDLMLLFLCRLLVCFHLTDLEWRRDCHFSGKRGSAKRLDS